MRKLLFVNVGQGLLPTGSGLVGFSGMYATGKIGTVTNVGNPNGDIRGNIVSAEEDQLGVLPITSLTGMDSINVKNASIIGSTIATILDSQVPIPFQPQFIETSDISPIGVVINQNFVPPQGNPQVREYTGDQPTQQEQGGLKLYQAPPSHPYADAAAAHDRSRNRVAVSDRLQCIEGGGDVGFFGCGRWLTA